MKVFDFDKTLYKKDSSVMFFFYCLKRNPSIIKYLPVQMIACLKYLLGKSSKEEFKTKYFSFFRSINIKEYAEDFWNIEAKNLYLELLPQEEKAVVISASPEILLSPICNRLCVQLIATVVDEDGVLHGKNCKGLEKACRFRDKFPNAVIEEFYSDSTSDLPMANLAKRAFLVKKGEILPWANIDED